MKILLDTNILYSFINWPQGHINQLIRYYQSKNDLYLCPYVLEELKEIMYKKSKVNTVIGFERITRDIERIAFGMNFKVINSIPKQKYLCHTRDKKDDRILDAAICGNMDAVLTGDKDLIEFRCNKIKILNIHQ